MAEAERWAAGLGNPAYAIDDSAGDPGRRRRVDVISEGTWRHFPRIGPPPETIAGHPDARVRDRRAAAGLARPRHRVRAARRGPADRRAAAARPASTAVVVDHDPTSAAGRGARATRRPVRRRRRPARPRPWPPPASTRPTALVCVESDDLRHASRPPCCARELRPDLRVVVQLRNDAVGRALAGGRGRGAGRRRPDRAVHRRGLPADRPR